MNKNLFITGPVDNAVIMQIQKTKNVAQMHKALLPVLNAQANLDDVTHAQANAQIALIDSEIELITNAL